MTTLNIMMIPRACLLTLFTGALLALNGCSDAATVRDAIPTTAVRLENNNIAHKMEKLTQCEKELEILKKINNPLYKDHQQAFNHLMSNVAQYGDLRQSVNAQTQIAIDALYNYKVDLLCNAISQTTLMALVNNGEVEKNSADIPIEPANTSIQTGKRRMATREE
jgi:hypothetical protein